MHYGVKERSASSEKNVLDGIRLEMGRSFVREIDGIFMLDGPCHTLNSARSKSITPYVAFLLTKLFACA